MFIYFLCLFTNYRLLKGELIGLWVVVERKQLRSEKFHVFFRYQKVPVHFSKEGGLQNVQLLNTDCTHFCIKLVEVVDIVIHFD